jgi:hypothetical protein
MNTKNKPEEHPKPFQSQLWPHLERIRALRRERKMWPEIAEILDRDHGVHLSYRTIRNFFIRARNPNRRIPAGFEEILGAKPASPAPVSPPEVSSPQANPSEPVQPTENPSGAEPESTSRPPIGHHMTQPKNTPKKTWATRTYDE